MQRLKNDLTPVATPDSKKLEEGRPGPKGQGFHAEYLMNSSG
jgi:hypothetical protein